MQVDDAGGGAQGIGVAVEGVAVDGQVRGGFGLGEGPGRGARESESGTGGCAGSRAGRRRAAGLCVRFARVLRPATRAGARGDERGLPAGKRRAWYEWWEQRCSRRRPGRQPATPTQPLYWTRSSNETAWLGEGSGTRRAGRQRGCERVLCCRPAPGWAGHAVRQAAPEYRSRRPGPPDSPPPDPKQDHDADITESYRISTASMALVSSPKDPETRLPTI